MAVEGDIKFGLNVNRNLADIVNKGEGLANLGVNVKDLDIIRNAAGTLSITTNDIKAVSGLNVEIETYMTKLYNDTQQYAAIIDQTAGTTETLKGNLVINGFVGASAIKYKYIDPDNITLKVADISTSRVSSWSSTDNPATDTSPIFYGGQIEVDGVVDTPNLEFLEPAEAVRFRDSEVPTHIVEAEFDGQTVYLYAMKGIPLIFDGFFRDLTSRLELTSSRAVSWIITNESASYLTREYENVGGSSTTVSELRFRDTRAAPRKIKIYVNPNTIKTLPLEGAGIQTLPAATLEALTTLRLSRNIIKNFPNFKEFSPILTYLDIRENNFTLGEDADLRKLNNNVVDRIPITTRNLLAGNTFNGSVTGQFRPGTDEMPTVTSDVIRADQQYEIVTLGDTDWSTVFGISQTYTVGYQGLAVAPSAGTGTAKRLIGRADMKKFRTYEIVSIGSDDITQFGASDLSAGATFEATRNSSEVFNDNTGSSTILLDVTVGLPALREMNLNSHSRGGARNFFDRDGDDPTGSTPDVPDTCQSYQMYRNSFDSLAPNVKSLPDLRSIQLYSNQITDGNFFIESDEIDYINIGANTGINIPNVSNKAKLDRFYAHYNRGQGLGADNNLFVTPQGTYKFANCGNLDLIYAYAGNYYGPIQKFAGNSQLNYIQARYTGLSGGKAINANLIEDTKEYSIFYNPEITTNQIQVGEDYEIRNSDDFDFTTLGAPDNNVGTIFEAVSPTFTEAANARVRADLTKVGAANNNQGTIFNADLSVNSMTNSTVKVIDREYVIHPDVFDDTPSMGTIQIASGRLLNKPLHPEVFKNINPGGIWIQSFNAGVSGNIPLLNNVTNLRYILLLQNNLTGPVPNFANNPRCYYVHFYGNSLTGNVPNIESNSMAYLYLHRNALTGFTGFNCPNMRRLFLSYNQITGAIPNLSNLTRMYDFYINNNQISGYEEGALAGATALYRFDISNNPTMTTGAINTLIADMVANYENNPRGNVNVNIRNTATPTGDAVEQIEFLRSQGWNIRT